MHLIVPLPYRIYFVSKFIDGRVDDFAAAEMAVGCVFAHLELNVPFIDIATLNRFKRRCADLLIDVL